MEESMDIMNFQIKVDPYDSDTLKATITGLYINSLLSIQSFEVAYFNREPHVSFRQISNMTGTQGHLEYSFLIPKTTPKIFFGSHEVIWRQE